MGASTLTRPVIAVCLACSLILSACGHLYARVKSAHGNSHGSGESPGASESVKDGANIRLRSFTAGASGSLKVVPTPSGGRVQITASGLPQPQALDARAHAFIVWAVAGGRVLNLGRVSTDARGDGHLDFASPATLERYSVIISAEEDEKAKKLTGTPVLSTRAGEVNALFPEKNGADGGDQAVGRTSAQARTIIVDDRTLTGPLSSPQQRGGRIFLPVVSIARALGDTIKTDAAARTVEVHRQTGTVADFNAQLNQVRENGSVTLAVSNTADIIFPPNADELMLPVEIVSALLDASIRLDEAAQAIRITRAKVQAETVRTGARRSSFELYQLEYDYNLNMYSSASNQNLTLRADGRLWDGRFNLITNSSTGKGTSFGLLRNFTFTYERPNGQRLIGGDFGTGTDLPFMSSTVRGLWAQMPLGSMRLTAFAGRAISGVYPVQPLPILSLDAQQQIQLQQSKLRYDTNIFGAYTTFGPSASNPYRAHQLLFSAGMLSFDGPHRSGQMLTGSARYASGRSRLQADIAGGRFKGTQYDGTQVNGAGLAADLSASFNVSDNLALQGRYLYVGKNFLGPQGGLYDPISQAAGGVTWRPRQWLTASLTSSFSTRPDYARQKERFVAMTLNLTPHGSWPSILFSHTESNSTQAGAGAYTLLSASKDFKRWRLFVNATRVKTPASAFMSAQVGGNLRLGESSTLQVSQSFGSRGTLGGTVDWQMQSLFNKRLSLSAGFGYNRGQGSPMTTNERLSASLRLPRQSTLQFTYLQSQTGPTMLLSLRGLLLRRASKAEVAASAPISELNSYASFYGRVYQDINLNGRFDPGLDVPQANVKVRVDGNRYVVSDESGRYRLDEVKIGEHNIYLDLLSVRADLTLLDGSQQTAILFQGRDSIVDFRLVRTGRITGVVWLDQNGNGQLDEGEQPLADVRIVAGSGRDTLTDENGIFHIGDLAPGEHVILVDEKTLPEKTISNAGSLSVKVLAGSETGNILFPITPAPPEIKVFSSK